MVAGNQQNAAARALLGKDYVTLVDMIDVRGKGGDEDALGANVNEYFVRDIANTGHGYEKGRHIAGLSKNRWCPGEDSVTRARPRLRLQAQPFESSRKARRRFASWAENEKRPACADLF
ncbi:hypothetical protein [Burkholderia ubonensis]|uniref:hypothetical protein n=1 Tax=Burkholderia ubonensis TaxID=101571 RepID=UPI0012F76B3D|nr:hypothetical protein [Burkholderia ubonensis]